MSVEQAPILTTELVEQIDYDLPVPSKKYPGSSYCPAYRSKDEKKDVAFQSNAFDPLLFDADADPKQVADARAALLTVRSLLHLNKEHKFYPSDGVHKMWFKRPTNLDHPFRMVDTRNKRYITEYKQTIFKRGDIDNAIIEYGYHPVCTQYPTQDSVKPEDKDECVVFRVDEKTTQFLVQDAENPRKMYKGNINHMVWGRPLYVVFRHRGISIKGVNETYGSLEAIKIVILNGVTRTNYDFNTQGMDIEIADDAPPPLAYEPSETLMETDATAGQPYTDQTVVINGETSWGGGQDGGAMPPVF